MLTNVHPLMNHVSLAFLPTSTPQLFIHHSTTSSLVNIIRTKCELKLSQSYRLVDLALLGAQVLAGISENGIPAPGGRTLHPSDAQLRGFFDDLWNNALRPQLENTLSSKYRSSCSA